MYRSIGYIHWQWTGPHMNNCYTKCTGRCVMTFKNVGGNSFLNIHVTITMIRIISSKSAICTSFSHNFWNTLHILIIATCTSSSKTLRIATGNTYMENTLLLRQNMILSFPCLSNFTTDRSALCALSFKPTFTITVFTSYVAVHILHYRSIILYPWTCVAACNVHALITSHHHMT